MTIITAPRTLSREHRVELRCDLVVVFVEPARGDAEDL
jgi:hypothetical protein